MDHPCHNAALPPFKAGEQRLLEVRISSSSSDGLGNSDFVSPTESESSDVLPDQRRGPIRAVKILPSIEGGPATPSLSIDCPSISMSDATSPSLGSNGFCLSPYLRLHSQENSSDYTPSRGFTSISPSTSGVGSMSRPNSDDNTMEYSITTTSISNPELDLSVSSCGSPESEDVELKPRQTLKGRFRMLHEIAPIPTTLPTAPSHLTKITLSEEPVVYDSMPQASTLSLHSRSVNRATNYAQLDRQVRAISSIPPPEFYGQHIEPTRLFKHYRGLDPKQIAVKDARYDASRKDAITKSADCFANPTLVTMSQWCKDDLDCIPYIDLSDDANNSHDAITEVAGLNGTTDSNLQTRLSVDVVDGQCGTSDSMKRKRQVYEDENAPTPRKAFKKYVTDKLNSLDGPEKHQFQHETREILQNLFNDSDSLADIIADTSAFTEQTQEHRSETSQPSTSQSQSQSSRCKKSRKATVAELEKQYPRFSKDLPAEGSAPDSEIIRIGKLESGYERHRNAPYAFSYRGRLYHPWTYLLQAQDEDGQPVWTLNTIRRLAR
ncbi:uncharacterized protein KY384_008946 [Bacidia gigantensis]|uniref:uncharacterized protein n=1 Tax=Bacidia gigantensis TaxID=2732470 RepID=UPI001D03C69E|nr:uncharacterized protein KY384_008946 [Bacidia gigantensis]KAG8525302.1 hypothetical protein KY384_008946 [Bacidia gigantensis]